MRPPGTWTITIPQLWYATDNGGPETSTIVTDPVIFNVDVPYEAITGRAHSGAKISFQSSFMLTTVQPR